jgi:dextranase
MRLIDVYPTHGTFAPGQPVTLVAEVEAGRPMPATLTLSIRRLAAVHGAVSRPVALTAGRQSIGLEWPPLPAPHGYAAEVALSDSAGETVDRAATAFDVLPSWTAFPRYGFLTDFTPGRTDITETIAALARFHINGLQLYDWHYRHDRLLPPAGEYQDPLGRRLSLSTVRRCLEAAHAHGMAGLAYLAVYAASVAYWRAHPADALYGGDGQPIAFGENFLGLMDPTPGGRWARHLLDECRRVLEALPFDGLHVDQYGEPRTAYDAAGRPVDLPAAFAAFVAALKAAHPGTGVLFNAVANWPSEALASSPQDFAYIEIWPPATRYRDVARIVTEARALSGGKPAVIALYLPADRLTNLLLADAVIGSCGGARIELGERERLLADPYFPKHQALGPEARAALRRYSDFLVRYGDLIGPSAACARQSPVQAPEGVWTMARRSKGWLTICLVNFTGLGDPGWDEGHPPPQAVAGARIGVALPKGVQAAWWASPDQGGLELLPLDVMAEGGTAWVTVPRLDRWAIVALQTGSEA